MMKNKIKNIIKSTLVVDNKKSIDLCVDRIIEAVELKTIPFRADILNQSVSAIYFADNSDYLGYHYEIVRIITGIEEPSPEYIKKIYKELNKRNKSY